MTINFHHLTFKIWVESDKSRANIKGRKFTARKWQINNLHSRASPWGIRLSLLETILIHPRHSPICCDSNELEIWWLRLRNKILYCALRIHYKRTQKHLRQCFGGVTFVLPSVSVASTPSIVARLLCPLSIRTATHPCKPLHTSHCSIHRKPRHALRLRERFLLPEQRASWMKASNLHYCSRDELTSFICLAKAPTRPQRTGLPY